VRGTGAMEVMGGGGDGGGTVGEEGAIDEVIEVTRVMTALLSVWPP
jgi:hypothetical protein